VRRCDAETDRGDDQGDNGFHNLPSTALGLERKDTPPVVLLHKLQICLSWWRIWVRSAEFYRRIFLQAFQELIDDLRNRRGDP